MTIDDIRQLADIFNALVMPGAMIAVTAMQVINFVRAGQIKDQVQKVELATNSLQDRQRIADHAAGVLEERERQDRQRIADQVAGVLEERERGKMTRTT